MPKVANFRGRGIGGHMNSVKSQKKIIFRDKSCLAGQKFRLQNSFVFKDSESCMS